MPGGSTIRGTDEPTVRRALRERVALPGTRESAGVRGFTGVRESAGVRGLAGVRGFAGVVRNPPGIDADAALVRDVMGRVPLFSEVGVDEPTEPGNWSFRPHDLTDPDPVHAGAARTSRADGSGPANHRIWTLPDPEPVDNDREAVEAVGDAIDAALADAFRQATGASKTAVAFSGGVDSALVAASVEGPLYVAGFPESHDVEAARDAARAMDRDGDLRVIDLSLEAVERAVPDVARAIGRTNAMDLAIALPLYLVAREVARDGYARLAVGQGADELFGGYAKVAKAPEDPRVDADTVRGARREVVGTLPDQLVRDDLAIRAAAVEPVAPLLDDRVVRAALELPGHLLVDDRGERKVALRRAARGRIPARVAFREKKAVQYGSLVARELDRLARRAGFKRRMDDHVSQYVRARVESASE